MKSLENENDYQSNITSTTTLKSIGARLVILPLGNRKVLYVDGSPASSKVTLGEAINTVLLMWSLRKGRFSQRMD